MMPNSPAVAWQPQPGPQTFLCTCPEDIGDLLFGGARGGGKTDGVMGLWLDHASRYLSKAKGIIFRRSMSELEEVHSRMMEVYPAIGASFRASSKTWIMPGGATLKLRFLDADEDALKYHGHAYTFMAFDEAGNWPSPRPIDMLRATLRSAHGVPCRLVLTGNPGGKGHDWIKERYISPARPMTPFRGEDGQMRVFIPSRLQDNRILMEKDPSYIERLRASGPAWLVKAWLEGDWEATETGNLFQRDYWRFYDEAPRFDRVIQSLDSAFKTGAENDYSVLETFGQGRDGYYLLHVWRGKVEFPELKRQVLGLADAWVPHELLVEDKASGQSLIQELQRDSRLPIRPVQVDRDKISRAQAVTPLVEAGKVFLPKSAPWLADFIEELASFPKGSHDDQVDAFTQALNHLRGGAGQGLLDYYRELAEEVNGERP
jgi:predicted phage terminase large subunit-like protein